MRIIDITEDKVERLSEHVEKLLRHAGKAMQLIEEFYGEGYGERDRDRDEDWDDDDRYGERHDYDRPSRRMGMRRRRRADGRYM